MTSTLKQLQNEQLFKRESFADIPPPVEYSLIEDGQGLKEAVVPILKMGGSEAELRKEKVLLSLQEDARIQNKG